MIIGVTGRARNGKDTLADVFVKHYRFTKVSLAQPIKDCCKIIFGWNEEHVNGALKEIVDEQYGISPRQAMQAMGTEFGQHALCELFPKFNRVTGRSLWVKRVINMYNDTNRSVFVIIPDVRFLHEVDAIKSVGGIIIKVDRHGVGLSGCHQSEMEIKDIKEDIFISNNGTIEDYRLIVKDIADTLCKED